ncbi:MAG TPA: hypothetical protein VFQ79_09205 [Bryobacteraceae bacterium]|nr:hypothetical protein [Bryobacteraceae bacterium]
MKRFLLIVMLALPLCAQKTVPWFSGTGGAKVGPGSPPLTCQVGELFLQTSSTSIYGCTERDTWTLFSGEGWALPEPTVSAAAAVILDYETGQVVWSKAPDVELKQASTTKLMTALLAHEYDPELDDQVTVSATAAATVGTRAELVTGEVIAMSELLRGLMLPSGNDAAVAIAEHVGRTYLGGTDGATGYAAFIARMNSRAGELGLGHTAYATPHGMDAAGHYTTARELAALGRVYLGVPALRSISATLSYAGTAVSGGPANPHNWKNTNRALGQYPGTISGKTGTTVQAGQCLMALHQMGGNAYIVAILGSTDRYQDATAMWEYAHTLAGTEPEGLTGRSNTAHVDLTGSWPTTSYFPGSYPTNGYGIYSSSAGATATYRFWGTGVQVVTSRSSARGRFDVALDGGTAEMVELYSATATPGVVVWEVQDLPLGMHTIVLTVRADRHASSSANTCPLEDFVVTR